MPARLTLSLISGPDAVRLETRTVDGYEFTLGRGQDADWALVDPDRNALSRRHCMLSLEDEDWWLLDLSGNGTFLNHDGEPIGEGRKRRLRDGDRIRLGPYEFQAQLAAPAPPRPAFRTGAGAGPVDEDDPWSPAATPPPRHGRGVANPFSDDDAKPMAPPGLAHPGAAVVSNPFSDTADQAWPPAVAERPHLTPPVHTSDARTSAQADNPFAAASPAQEPAVMTPPGGHGADAKPANPFAEPGDDDPASAPVAAIGPGAESPVTPPAEIAATVTPPPAVTAPATASPVPAPPLPGVAAPAPAQATQPAEPPAVRLLAALLEGAGLPDATLVDPEKALRDMGAAFRAVVIGLRDVQRARRTVRGGFRITQTTWTENPLKGAVSDDDALEALLGAGRRTPMAPARAVADVLKDIVLHEVATVAAMQEAVRTLLATLAPEQLREAAEHGGLALLPAQRKARAWDAYEAAHARTIAALTDDFDSVFGKAFARAYERVMTEQGR